MLKSAQQVFDEWGQDHRGLGMQKYHWPRVRQAFDMIADQTGNYLEIGTGTGYAIKHMATHQFARGHCYGIEISEQMVQLTLKEVEGLPNVKIQHGNFLNPDFAAGCNFAMIFSMEVFYYLPDMQAGLNKAYTLLEPGGQLWVLVNYYEENNESENWPEQVSTPMQRWSMAEYCRGFEKAGFSRVEQMSLTNTDGIEFKDSRIGTLCTYGVR